MVQFSNIHLIETRLAGATNILRISLTINLYHAELATIEIRQTDCRTSYNYIFSSLPSEPIKQLYNRRVACSNNDLASSY